MTCAMLTTASYLKFEKNSQIGSKVVSNTYWLYE